MGPLQTPWHGHINSRIEFGAGSLELSEADLEWKTENLVEAGKVLLNEIGLKRVNAERQSLGLAALSAEDVALASLGEEVVDALLDQAGSELLGTVAASATLPSGVDNSTLPYFPGIRSQGSLGSCAAFSATYYTLTYMTALARGWDVSDTSDNTNKFSPKWTYNMVNDGEDGGSNIVEVMSVLADHGAATWAEMPYDSDYQEWVYDDPDVWRNAIQYRPNDMGYISDVDEAAGLEQVKTMLANGYILNFRTYIDSWQYTTISDDPSTTADDDEVGKLAAYWVNGAEGGHVMAVVGYNDDIWIDINGNGSVDSGEQGAFRIANSWGTGWKDGGFTWLSYDALQVVSAVDGGPSSGRKAAWRSNEAYWLNAREDYTPTLLAEFSIQHAERYQFSITVGTADAGETTPERTWTPSGLSSDGGTCGFDGGAYTTTSAAPVGTFVLDMSDLGVDYGKSTNYFLGVNDDTDASLEAIVSSFTLTDSLGNMLATSTDTPITDADDYTTVVYASVESTLTDFVVDTQLVTVDEGGTADVQVKLASAPSSDVTVTATWLSGDEDLAVTDGGTLVFTASNWDEYQTVTVSAGQDADYVNGEGVLQFSASGLRPIPIKIAEVDDEAIYVAMMDTDPGWTLQGDWAWGSPQGGGGSRGEADPTSGVTGSSVIGYNLAGDYEANISTTQWATTPGIDCSDYTDVELRLYRWLGVETSTYDHASIEISSDGSTWTEVWANTDEVADSFWSRQVFDISEIADGQSAVYIRFGLGSTDSSVQYCGWNIDDVCLTGNPIDTASPVPTSVDLVASVDTGGSDTDDVTKIDNSDPTNVLQFEVADTVSGATVVVYADGTPIGSATASGSTTMVTTDGDFDLSDGVHTITATQTESGGTESDPSPGLAITIDTVIPTAEIVDVSPDPRSTAVDSIQIEFSEPVAGFELTDLELSLDSATVSLASASLNSGNPDGYSDTFSLDDLDTLTAAAGAYELTLDEDTAIADLAGNVVQAGDADAWSQYLATISAGEQSSTIEVSCTATEHIVTIDGVSQAFNRAAVTEIQIDAGEGSDRVTVIGADADETAVLTVDSLTFSRPTEGFSLSVSGVESIVVDAQGGTADQAQLTGSTGSNRLYSHADSDVFSNTNSFRHEVVGFDTVSVTAPVGGSNYAFLYDSPGDDVLEGDPESTLFDRDEGWTDLTATGFARVYAYVSEGGTDTAELTGSTDSLNRLYGYADYSILTDQARSFYFYTRGFNEVAATSPSDGYAYLYDGSGNDQLIASPTTATMTRDTTGPMTMATGFNRVYAFSTRGGTDTAQLTGAAAANTFRASPTYSTLTDTARSFYHYVRGFESVTAIGSSSDPSGDRAYLYDSTAADTLYALTDRVYLEDSAGAYHNEVQCFDYIYARSSDDESSGDSASIEDDLLYQLVHIGTW